MEKIEEEKTEIVQKKNDRFSATEVLILLVICCVLSVTATIIITGNKNLDGTSENDNKSLSTIMSTYKFIKDNYYDSIDETKVVDGAIKGMLEATGDPYSTYMQKDEYSNFNISMQGNYQGLGVEIGQKDDTIIVTYIFPDSPASNSDLKVGDRIVSVDDISAKGMTTSDFSKYVRESGKSSVKIVVSRDGKEITLNIERKNVELKSVASKIIDKNNKKIGYIYISVFAANTDQQFAEELSKLEKENIDSLIIDLRGNGGGHLTSVTSMISLFMDKTHVIYQIEEKGESKKTYSLGTKDRKYSIVMLVNENSASASEVMTASLKENLNAKVIGVKTYGKGTVQKVYNLPSGEQYKLTTQKWLTPNGNWINEKGIEPDIKVEMDDEYYKNPTDDNDNQLQKCIEYLLGQ